MICRRCSKDIADGSKVCPVCGTTMGTYTKLRDYSSSKPPKKTSKGSRLVSILTILLSIIGIGATLFFTTGSVEKKDYEQIIEAYEKGDDDLLMLSIAKFRNKYPNSKERIAEGEEMLKVLRGWAPATDDQDEDSGAADPVYTSKTPATERIKLESVSLGEPNVDFAHSLTIYWRNISDKTISNIYFTVIAYDAAGNPVKCTERGNSEALLEQQPDKFTPNATGNIYRSYWSNVWYNENIDYVKVKDVIIYYDDEERSWENLPMEVVE